MKDLPLHHHTEQLEKVKRKVSNGEKLNTDDINFLFNTIEQIEGESKEWADLYKENTN